jgi:uncharacterized membrane protein YeaQ/YmgE (transglycosylase-associated protein family)
MELSYFTYITGIASLFGFIAQILGWFPKYENTRRNILLVLIGIFAGSLFGAFNASQITFEFSVTGFTLLISAIGVVILVVLLVAIFSRDSSKRSEMYGVSGIATVVFMVVLMFGNFPNIENAFCHSYLRHIHHQGRAYENGYLNSALSQIVGSVLPHPFVPSVCYSLLF